MPVAHLGEICALLAPLAWSTALILYKRTDAPAASMNLFKNALAVGLLSLTLLAIGGGFPDDRSASDWVRLVVSALLGLALADTLLFEGLRRAGASRIAIVDTIYAPVVVVLSWLLLAETVTPAFLFGAAAIVAGLALATIRRGALRTETPEQWIGMAYGLGAIVCTALAVVLVKPVLERSELVEVTWTRLVIGVVGQAIWLRWRGGLGEALVAFRPAPLWRTLVPAAFIGTYLSLLLWLGGFKWADASVAAALNQMATVYILVQARVLLGEVLRPAQVVGALTAAGGAVWIVLSRL